jgi:hypothetical protein
MTVAKKNHGGARPGAGAKAQFDKPMERKQVMLDQRTVEDATRLGGGNLSAGLREAVRIAVQPAA